MSDGADPGDTGKTTRIGQGVAGAVKQVAGVGDAAQVAAAASVLDDARRRLYLLLAGETPAAAQDAAEPTSEADEADGTVG